MQKLAVGLLVMALAYLSESPPPTTIPPTATTTEDAAATTTTEEDATRDVSERSDGWARTAQMCLGGVGVGFTSCVTLDTVAAVSLRARSSVEADGRKGSWTCWLSTCSTPTRPNLLLLQVPPLLCPQVGQPS